MTCDPPHPWQQILPPLARALVDAALLGAIAVSARRRLVLRPLGPQTTRSDAALALAVRPALETPQEDGRRPNPSGRNDAPRRELVHDP